jgi:hypothetical protein
MARTEDMIGTDATVRDRAPMSRGAVAAHKAKVAAARQQVLEFARALARLAAQEDDAAEQNEAGPVACTEAASASETRRSRP